MKAGLEVVGLPLVTGDGHQVGTVRDLVLDDGGRQVLGVMLERGWLRRRRQFVALHQVQAIRRDRVVAQGDEAEGAPPPRANGSLTGKLAVSRTGRYLGVVGDVYFDERTGEVGAYEIVRPERPSGAASKTIVPAGACPAIADVLVVSDMAG
jgi:uncharacterized protein YrrD